MPFPVCLVCLMLFRRWILSFLLWLPNYLPKAFFLLVSSHWWVGSQWMNEEINIQSTRTILAVPSLFSTFQNDRLGGRPGFPFICFSSSVWSWWHLPRCLQDLQTSRDTTSFYIQMDSLVLPPLTSFSVTFNSMAPLDRLSPRFSGGTICSSGLSVLRSAFLG